jgi:hypothetical protein
LVMFLGEITPSLFDAVKALSDPKSEPVLGSRDGGVDLAKSSESSSFAGCGEGGGFGGIDPSLTTSSSG